MAYACGCTEAFHGRLFELRLTDAAWTQFADPRVCLLHSSLMSRCRFPCSQQKRPTLTALKGHLYALKACEQTVELAPAGVPRSARRCRPLPFTDVVCV